MLELFRICIVAIFHLVDGTAQGFGLGDELAVKGSTSSGAYSCFSMSIEGPPERGRAFGAFQSQSKHYIGSMAKQTKWKHFCVGQRPLVPLLLLGPPFFVQLFFLGPPLC
jgi:hypothetical protein